MAPTLVIPDKNTKGYLIRQQYALQYGLKVKSKERTDPTILDDMIELIAMCCVQGQESLDEAKAFVRNEISQSQFEEIFASITGGAANIIPPSSDTQSGNTTSQD